MLNPFFLFLVVAALCLVFASLFGVFWLFLFADTSMSSRDERRWSVIQQVTFGAVLACFIAMLASYLYYFA